MSEPVSAPDRKPDRVLGFTDGVVAIALTLLAFPLLDSTSSVTGGQETVAQWVRSHLGGIVFFVMSFGLVGRFWLTHEHILSYADAASDRLRSLNLVWLFGIATLPIATALLPSPPDAGQVLLYFGALLVCVGSATAMAVEVGRAPAARMPVRTLAAALASVVMLLVGLVLALAGLVVLPTRFKGLCYLGLFVLFGTRAFAPRLTGVARRLLRRAEAAG